MGTITLSDMYGANASANGNGAAPADTRAPDARRVEETGGNKQDAGGPAFSWFFMVLLLVGIRMLYEAAGEDL